MILNNTPSNEAILSNVGSVSSFTIKATAKSFSILSSGLYANKIRAIIRELSCNALDSHVASGNTSTPFVVHLPNSLEPYFSVRDFGVGLNHDQVVNIFTTFFESTKTGSNDFIGALGLGSKSPFSYTDNFTVTAIQGGVKAIYTAFINESGVPSIALMMSEQTDEANGVEIKFAVNERYDFSRFRDEAGVVFKFWQNRPTITGASGFEFVNPDFKDRDIVPGVHALSDNIRRSVAVMGNIAYPIELSDSQISSDPVYSLLSCSLVMEFNIGELDFQASREGLSYIPLTVNSIRAKLQSLNSQLTVHLTAEADAIENLWERADYLYKRMDSPLWAAAVGEYITATGIPLMVAGASRWDVRKKMTFMEDDLAKQFNIVIRAFNKARGISACNSVKGKQVRVNPTTFATQYTILSELDHFFVFNDTKTGALERAKFHWRNQKQANHHRVVYVIEPADRKQPIKQAEFLAAIHNPPVANVLMASSLMLKERAAGLGKNVTVMRLKNRDGSWNRSHTTTWVSAGTADSFDSNETHYYVPLCGFVSEGLVKDVKELKHQLESSGVYRGPIYGVRKGDAAVVAAKKNWVNIDVMIQQKLEALTQDNIMGVVKEATEWLSLYSWGNNVISLVDPSSPYVALYQVFKDVKVDDAGVRSGLEYLFRQYKVSTTRVDPATLIIQYRVEVGSMSSRYPLLESLNRYSDADPIAQYINLIDRSLSDKSTPCKTSHLSIISSSIFS